jgi:FtsP/CotA-like multicopper oxidase with cupredoxin domain
MADTAVPACLAPRFVQDPTSVSLRSGHEDEFRLLSRNGQPPRAHEVGRKDSFDVGRNDELRILVNFRDFLGKYVMHCHNLIHEDHAMMTRYDIVPEGQV